MLVPTIANRIITKDCKIYGRSSLAWLDLRFDGSNLSTVIENTGEALISAQTVSVQKIIQTDSKYGLGCWDCGSNAEYSTLTIPNCFKPSFGNFKIEFWFKIPTRTTGAARSLLRFQYKKSNVDKLIHIYMEYFSGHKLSINIPDTAITYGIPDWDVNRWYKFTMIYASTLEVLIDDVSLRTSNTIPDATEVAETTTFRFGPGEAAAGRQFYIDNFKIIKI